MSDTFVMPKIEYPDPMNLRLAALYLDVSEMRMRALVREERIKAVKSEEGHWLVSKAAIDAYKATRGVRTAPGKPHGDGKAFIVHVKFADHDKVAKALEPFGVKLEPRYDYAKQAAYREKRNIAKKAEKAKALSEAKAKGATPVAATAEDKAKAPAAKK